MSARMPGRTLAVMMRHAFRGKIALVHALGAIAAGWSSRFIYALGLALAAAHTGAAGPQGGPTYDAGRRHGRLADPNRPVLSRRRLEWCVGMKSDFFFALGCEGRCWVVDGD